MWLLWPLWPLWVFRAFAGLWQFWVVAVLAIVVVLKGEAAVALLGVLDLWEVMAVLDCSCSRHCCRYCGCFGPLISCGRSGLAVFAIVGVLMGVVHVFVLSVVMS